MTDRSLISRRRLLGGAAAGSAALLAGGAKASPATPAWDEERDVVVIGSGFAGLAAAIEARKTGAEVLVLEKMPVFGGNSMIDGGLMTATGAAPQKAAGVEDTPELLEQDMLEAGGHANDPAKVRLVASSAAENYAWCRDELGVKFKDGVLVRLKGHSVPRSVQTINSSGSAIVIPEIQRALALGVDMRRHARVEELLRSPDGRVEGLLVLEGDPARERRIRARKGVVACYGGFGADPMYVGWRVPALGDAAPTNNQPGATSELWRATAAIGALQLHDDCVECRPYGNPREKGAGIGDAYNRLAASRGFWVNRDGRRFVDESAPSDELVRAVMRENKEGRGAWALMNARFARDFRRAAPEAFDAMFASGLVTRWDTLDELGRGLGIDVEELKAETARFNRSVADGVDHEFGRPLASVLVPERVGPWYAGPIEPKVQFCAGGLATDLKGRVIDVRTDAPIPGLFAAGEATGGVHGTGALASVPILECLVFGRIAGRSAASGGRSA